MKKEEEREQIALFEWIKWKGEKLYPELKGINHYPIGGLRHKAVAAKLKRMGAKADMPDIHLPVARHGFHSLYIELKAQGGRLRKGQSDMLHYLAEQGNYTVVCVGWESARDTILDYLGGSNDKWERFEG